MTKWCVLLVIVCVLDDFHQFLSYAEAHPKLKSSLRHCSKGTLRTDDPDPVTKLTSRDRYLVRKSFEAVRKNPVESGMALLNLLFKEHPESLQLFPFRDVPLEERQHDIGFRLYSHQLINRFSAIVDAVHNVYLLLIILNEIGGSNQLHQETPKYFSQLKDAVIKHFSTFMKPEETKAWQKTLDIAIDVINNALRKKSAKNWK